METCIKNFHSVISLNIFIREKTYDKLNKLFATFCAKEELENTIKEINKRYSVIFDKIFILESLSTSELICTYNIEVGNVSSNIIKDTILLHRKKETNTLYTINALNLLVTTLNEGKLDKNFKINWDNYRNSILLVHEDKLKQVNTKLYKVINI